jgi:macrolide-specific efflux system membrane fusion protein
MGEALAGDAAAERGVDRGAERPAEGRRPRDAADGRDGAARPQGPAAGRADGPPTDESERERWRAQRRAAREAAGEASGGGGPEAGRGPAVTPVGAATPGVERAMPGGPAASRGLRGGRPPASDGGAPARVVTRATAARPQVPSEPAAEAPRRTVRRAIVKVISEQGAVQEREVLVGLSNRIQAEIVAGLQAGEKVVVGVRQAEPARRNGPQSPGQSPSQGARDGLGGAFGPPGAAPGMGGGPGRGG